MTSIDDLTTIPPKEDTVLSPQEQQILSQYFDDDGKQPPAQPSGGPPSAPSNTPPAQKSEEQEGAPSRFSKIPWKTVAYATLLFVLLGNPWIDGMMCKIPYCDSPGVLLGIKIVVFSAMLILLSMIMG